MSRETQPFPAFVLNTGRAGLEISTSAYSGTWNTTSRLTLVSVVSSAGREKGKKINTEIIIARRKSAGDVKNKNLFFPNQETDVTVSVMSAL